MYLSSIEFQSGKQEVAYEKKRIWLKWQICEWQMTRKYVKERVLSYEESGFATQADAYNALDKEIAAGTLQHIDRN